MPYEIGLIRSAMRVMDESIFIELRPYVQHEFFNLISSYKFGVAFDAARFATRKVISFSTAVKCRSIKFGPLDKCSLNSC